MTMTHNQYDRELEEQLNLVSWELNPYPPRVHSELFRQDFSVANTIETLQKEISDLPGKIESLASVTETKIEAGLACK
jgi:hypothetical protein